MYMYFVYVQYLSAQIVIFNNYVHKIQIQYVYMGDIDELIFTELIMKSCIQKELLFLLLM